MDRRVMAVFPAILVPIVITGLDRLQLSDGVLGLCTGTLIGLSFVTLASARRHPPAIG